MTVRTWPAGRRAALRLWRRGLGLAVAALALGLLGGFAWYVAAISRPTPPPGRADGIVVLTGGADRVRAGLRLLAKDDAPALLVSGIGGHAGLAALARQAGVDAKPLAARITLGRGATSTRGNATEIAAWAHARHARSLIVVTANYHMPRALTEIRRALPRVRLVPAAVATPASARLLAGEYLKLVAARLDLTAFAPRSTPQLSPAGIGAGR